MNPTLKKIFHAILLTIGMIVVLFLWDFFSKKLPDSFLEQIDDLLEYGVFGLLIVLGIGSVVFLYYNLFYEIYTQSILQRANKLLETSIDEGNGYLYVAVDCHQSGDESSPGYYIYLHYLFELKTGKKLVYKAQKTEREEGKAKEYFNRKLKKPIILKTNVIAETHFEKENYLIHIVPFKNRFDFGFEIICRDKPSNRFLWKNKI